MTQDEINKAFEGRWRYKRPSMCIHEDCEEEIKSICRDFFTTGILIAERWKTPSSLKEIKYEIPLTLEDALQFHHHLANDMLSFDTFWNAYDKKVGRPKCEKLWEKLTAQEKGQCLSYIPLYKQAQPDKQYRKNPETFLRNKAWNDEIIYRNGTDKPSIDQQRTDKLASILTE